MLRGTTKFKCEACGNVFESFDMEDVMTAGTMPMRCPKCGAMAHKKDSILSRIFG